MVDGVTNMVSPEDQEEVYHDPHQIYAEIREDVQRILAYEHSDTTTSRDKALINLFTKALHSIKYKEVISPYLLATYALEAFQDE